MTVQILVVLLMILLAAVTFDARGTNDLNTWMGWALHTSEIGIIDAYAAHPNYYPPLTISLLGACQYIADALVVPSIYVIKSSLLICLMIATCFIYFFSGHNLLLTFFAYCAFLLNALGLAYLDLYFTVPLLASLYFLHRKCVVGFSLCFSLACLVKYQPLMMAPFLAILLLTTLFDRSRPLGSIREIAAKLLLPGVSLWILAGIIFTVGLYRSFLSLGSSVWLSAQALNTNWILTRYLLQSGAENPFPPDLPPELAMIRAIPEIPGLWMNRIAACFYLAALVGFMLRKKTLENFLYFAILGNLAWFIWHTGAHENHLFLTALLAIVLSCLNPAHTRLMVLLVLMSSFNMFLFYGWNGSGPGFLPHSVSSNSAYDYRLDVYLWSAIIYVLLFFAIWGQAIYRFCKKD